MTSSLRPGAVFTHPTMLDPAWKPGPGQRYADAPKARCVVTATRGATTYFTYADHASGGGAFKASIADVVNWIQERGA